MTRRGAADHHPPAAALVATGACSVQFGAAIATHLFARVGPVGAVTLRLSIGAAVLATLLRPGLRGRDGGRWRSTGPPPLPSRPKLRSIPRADLAVAVGFGLVLAGMNLSFYEAIARIPLGVAVTIEFSGPLALALIGSRRLTDLLWAVLAGAGVALFTSSGGHLDPVGVGLAFLAGIGWIGYILLSQQTGRRFDTRTGLTLAMAAGAVVLMPVGLAVAGAALFQPRVLLLGAGVAVLSSVLPYSLELVALRQVTPRAFGVLLSVDPAMAALAGLVVLGQHLTARELAALLLVSLANLGNALTGRPGVVATTP
jgi:inner membrane transporter RhtA